MKSILALAAIFAIGTVLAKPTPEECPVHHEPLRPVKLKIVYGLPAQPLMEEIEAAQKLFPFGSDYVLGGCVVQAEKKVDGFLCPACVKARAAWLKARRD